MLKLSDEMLARQPKTVQTEIRNLRQQVEQLEAKIKWLEDEDKNKAEQSNTLINDSLNHRSALLPNTQVEFHINDPEHKHWRSYVDVRVSTDGNRVEVHGSDPLEMQFHASNHVTFTLRK